MNKFTSPLLVTLFALTSIGCQKAVEFKGGTFGDEQTGSQNVSLCANGTLDCIVEGDGNAFTDLGTGFQQLYTQCVEGCVEAAGAGQQAACESQCADLTADPQDDYASHELKIPDSAKAIEVEIRACLGAAVHNSIQFQGPLVTFQHFRTTLSQAMSLSATSMLTGGAKGDPVGKDIGCGIEGLGNKVEVTWKPVTSSTVSIMDVPHTVIPFTSGTEIKRKYGSPVVAPFGVPFEYRSEINFQQSAWVQKKVRTSINTTVVNNFQYLNNDTGLGYSYVHIFPSLKTAPVVISMVLFAQDAAMAQ